MLQRIDFAALARSVLRTGLTTRELGAKLGTSQPHASRIASGRLQSISGDVAVRLIVLAGGEVKLPEHAEEAANAG